MRKFLKQEPEIIDTPPGHRISVIRQFCKGCEICISFCPKDVLGLDSRMQKVAICNPDRCTGCRLCEWYCPDFAIFVEPARKSVKAAAAGGA